MRTVPDHGRDGPPRRSRPSGTRGEPAGTPGAGAARPTARMPRTGAAGARRPVRPRRRPDRDRAPTCAGWPTNAASSRPAPGPGPSTAEETLRGAQRAYDDHNMRGRPGRARRRRPGDPPGEGRRPGALPDRALAAPSRPRKSRPPPATGCSRSTHQRRGPRRDGRAGQGARGRPHADPATWSGSRWRPTRPGSPPRRPRLPAWRRARPSRPARKRLPARSPTCPAAPPPPPGDGRPEDDEPLAAALGSGGTPRIFRLVRGDRAAMVELVAAMAGDDPGERKHWQLAPVRPRRRDPRRQHRGGLARFPRRPRLLGPVHAQPEPRHRRARCRPSAIDSTAWAAGSTVASRRSATCRWRWATPASTRCASATGPPRPRWPSCIATSPWRPTSGSPARPAT